MKSEMHPKIETLLASFANMPLPPISSMDATAMRRIFDYPLPVAPIPVGESRDIKVPGAEGLLDARLYLPQRDSSERITVFFHGGGFVTGTLDTHDNLCRALCREFDSAVISVAYRRAPENPYPAAPEDCYAAVQWAAENRSEFAATDASLLLAGDSAGACLCISVSLLARQRQGPLIDGQLLFYPTVTPPSDSDSYTKFGGGEYLLSREMMEFYWKQYLGDSAIAEEIAAPLCCEDLKGLPPTQIIIAELDPLRDEGELFHRRLKQAGNNVNLSLAPGMIHGFMTLPGLETEVTTILGHLSRELE